MKKNSFRGFTLVELLGVLVILAAIALIITPSIRKTISNSQMKNFVNSAHQLVRAGEIYYSEKDMMGELPKNLTFKFPRDVKKLSVKAQSIENGTMMINEKGEISIAISNGDYCVRKSYKENKMTVGKGKEDCYIYVDESINGLIPELRDGMIPININDNGETVKAHATSKWYDYSNQKWANAVTVKASVREKYMNANEGTLIEKDDILTYLVWIPRYEYKIEGTYGTHTDGTLGTQELPGEILVNFIPKDQTTASNGYIIHPAFTFGDKELSGIWVGKFETSYDASLNELECSDENCELSDSIRIVPDKQALTNKKISTMFYVSRSMNRENNAFGIDLNEIDTHMMKNSEWGAVAYLSQSKYGKYGNNSYQGRDKEVYINNSVYRYTGRSGGSYGGNTILGSAYPGYTDNKYEKYYGYYTYDGFLLKQNYDIKTATRNLKAAATTTGNMTGIYDMSGGSWEYVASYLGDYALSSFTDIPESKYFDKYLTADSTTACNGGTCYGHALSETKYWYDDYGHFGGASWILRGGYNSNKEASGVFSSNGSTGDANVNYSFRIVFVNID